MKVDKAEYGVPINMDKVLEIDPFFPLQKLSKIIICFLHQNVIFVVRCIPTFTLFEFKEKIFNA